MQDNTGDGGSSGDGSNGRGDGGSDSQRPTLTQHITQLAGNAFRACQAFAGDAGRIILTPAKPSGELLGIFLVCLNPEQAAKIKAFVDSLDSADELVTNAAGRVNEQGQLELGTEIVDRTAGRSDA